MRALLCDSAIDDALGDDELERDRHERRDEPCHKRDTQPHDGRHPPAHVKAGRAAEMSAVVEELMEEVLVSGGRSEKHRGSGALVEEHELDDERPRREEDAAEQPIEYPGEGGCAGGAKGGHGYAVSSQWSSWWWS